MQIPTISFAVALPPNEAKQSLHNLHDNLPLHRNLLLLLLLHHH